MEAETLIERANPKMMAMPEGMNMASAAKIIPSQKRAPCIIEMILKSQPGRPVLEKVIHLR